MAKPIQLSRARAALDAQWPLLRRWIGDIPHDSYEVPSVLEGMTVGELVAHIGRGLTALTACEPAGPDVKPLSIAEYVGTYPAGAAEIAQSSRELAIGVAADPLGALDESRDASTAALTSLGASDRVVVARRGPIRLGDLVATRVLELVVHADDLARSLPGSDPPPVDGDARRLVVRLLLDAFADAAPGRTVEVRIPLHGAVQAVPGPRHTRGTPPNVVETDATTWVRLACGRVGWNEAIAGGHVRASGQRADLTDFLPLL